MGFVVVYAVHCTFVGNSSNISVDSIEDAVIKVIGSTDCDVECV